MDGPELKTSKNSLHWETEVSVSKEWTHSKDWIITSKDCGEIRVSEREIEFEDLQEGSPCTEWIESFLFSPY